MGSISTQDFVKSRYLSAGDLNLSKYLEICFLLPYNLNNKLIIESNVKNRSSAQINSGSAKQQTPFLLFT